MEVKRENVRVDDVGVDAGGSLVPGVLAGDTRHGVGLNPLQVLYSAEKKEVS
jgi:hypothetical protein